LPRRELGDAADMGCHRLGGPGGTRSPGRPGSVEGVRVEPEELISPPLDGRRDSQRAGVIRPGSPRPVPCGRDCRRPSMPLDPLAVKFLEASAAVQPPMWQLSAPEVRERRVLPPPGPEVHEVMDMEAAGPEGPVPVRIYWPREADALPALVWYHGGGWSIGSVESADPTARRLCTLADCVVISVDYRLAPEHPYPAAADDAYAIAVWAVQNAPRMNIDSSRIAIGGDSA